MSSSAVVVADDNAATCGEIVEWLKAHDVAAYAVSDSSVIELVQQVRARVVICRPGSTGIALFHALQESADPPVVVLLSDAPSAKDEIYCNGRMLVTVVRMPVNPAALARFVKSVVSITARLDASALATLLNPGDEASRQAPDAAASNTMRFRIVH